MKAYLITLLFCGIALSSCSNNTPSGFDTAKERLDEERKGSVLGKDALTWEWSKDADEKTVTGDDPMWAAVSRITSEHPISFNNFHARIIQTEWITPADKTDIRYRFTFHVLGKSPKADSLEVLMMMEKKQGSNWVTATPDTSIRQALIDRIVSEAIRIYDQNKRD
ncbi:MAG: DUF3576 domain-containing protein [Alphaproteobacteria bacterium]|nr:DUF3576 domain-containing protein [Alphaproteobacteria bacterium]